MCSTNQTSGHQTSNHQPSSAGLRLFGCATRIEGVQPTRSSAGLPLIECATRSEGVQATTVCGSASFGAQANQHEVLVLSAWAQKLADPRGQHTRFHHKRRYVDLPVSGLKLLSTRSLCCQLGPKNWQIHIHRAQGVRFATDTRTL